MIRVVRETHETPVDVRERITRAGGLNRLGEPNFRVVWGGARLAWIGGRWVDRDASGNVTREAIELRQEPKYAAVDRWHIERWVPPEAYGSPEEWSARTTEIEDGVHILALGPYPCRGEYEHCFTLQTSSGAFVQLSPAACDWIVRAVEWARRQSPSVAKGAISQRESSLEREWERVADDVLDDTAPARVDGKGQIRD